MRGHPNEARRLTHTSRYIDDLCAINTEILKDIYPHIYGTLPLSFDDTSNGTGHYLDLLIDTNNGSLDLYDKRNDFNFDVIRFSSALTNCPQTVAIYVSVGQIIRISRICTRKEDFLKHLKDLCQTIINKGYGRHIALAASQKVAHTYTSKMLQFDLDTKKKVLQWFNATF